MSLAIWPDPAHINVADVSQIAVVRRAGSFIVDWRVGSVRAPQDERTGAAMNFLDDLRAEWIAIRKSLGDHIAYLEAGNRIHPIDQDPNEATTEFLERLRHYRSEVEGWLIHLPSQGE